MEDATATSMPATAARVAVQQRCADAYLHDIRGSMQALFGAVELLCRVAKSAGENSARAEKACELARRAIGQHEKTTLDLFQLLTHQTGGVQRQDLRAMVDEVLHLFRNDIAARGMSVQISAATQPTVSAERGALHGVLAGLLSVAIDSSSVGTPLRVQVAEQSGYAIVTIQTSPDAGGPQAPQSLRPPTAASPRMVLTGDMLLDATRQFLSEHGGRLDLVPTDDPGQRTLRMMLPAL